MPQTVITYNRITKEELATNLYRLMEEGNWIDLLQNTSTVYRETIHERDGVGFTSWIVVYHKIAEAEPAVENYSDAELCMETSPIGLKCMLSKGHRGDHSAPIGVQSDIYWPSPAESAVAQRPSERGKALRDAARAVCAWCDYDERPPATKKMRRGLLRWVHPPVADWDTEQDCEASGIWELIEREIAARDGQEGGEG